MSLCSTWVLAQDGKFYQDPVLRGEDWFLCFDDDEPPELVIAVERGTHPGVVKARAAEIMGTLGIRWQFLSSRPRFSGRCFGPFRNLGRFKATSNAPRNAGAVFVKLEDPIPVPAEYDGCGSFEEATKHACVYYDFGRRVAQ